MLLEGQCCESAASVVAVPTSVKATARPTDRPTKLTLINLSSVSDCRCADTQIASKTGARKSKWARRRRSLCRVSFVSGGNERICAEKSIVEAGITGKHAQVRLVGDMQPERGNFSCAGAVLNEMMRASATAAAANSIAKNSRPLQKKTVAKNLSSL